MKQKLVTLFFITGLTIPSVADAARYQLRLQSSEAISGYISLRIFNTRGACRRAMEDYKKKNPDRVVECKKIK